MLTIEEVKQYLHLDSDAEDRLSPNTHYLSRRNVRKLYTSCNA